MTRRFKTPADLLKTWKDYKEDCDHRTVTRTEFSSKLGKFCSAEVPASVTYTIEGFCIYAGLARSAFYSHYVDVKKYAEAVELIRTECEIDARSKLEMNIIATSLAGLWMGKYGYTTKQEVSDNTAKAKAIDNIQTMVEQLHEAEDDDVAD